MLDISYNALQYSKVVDLNNFYREKLPEILKIKAMIENSKLLFGLSSNRVILEIAEGQRIYRITFLNTDVNKNPFGYLVYIPQQHRLDIYSIDSGTPLIQWKNRKPVFKSYGLLLDKAGLDKIFNKILNAS